MAAQSDLVDAADARQAEDASAVTHLTPTNFEKCFVKVFYNTFEEYFI